MPGDSPRSVSRSARQAALEDRQKRLDTVDGEPILLDVCLGQHERVEDWTEFG